MRKKIIFCVIGSLALLAAGAGYVFYDPSVPWSDARDRIEETIASSVPHGKLVELRSLQLTDLRVPLTVRIHPRYRGIRRTMVEDTSGLLNFVIQIGDERIRLDVHRYCARVCGFFLSVPPSTQGECAALVSGLRKAFPGLQVKIETREVREAQQVPGTYSSKAANGLTENAQE